MTTQTVPIKFVVGSRKLLSVPRVVQTLAFGLDDLIGGTLPQWPAPGPQVQGLRILSAPASQLGAIRARYPGYLVGGLQHYRRFYIEMEGRTYADYLGLFSSKTRSTFNRKRRKLAEASGGALDLREFHGEADVEAFMADAVPLSRRTYQTRLLDAGLPEGPEAIAAMKALARRDELRAYILYIGGQPASYLYLPTTGGVVTYAFLGYDPDHAHLSVGTVLQMEVLERLFGEARYRYFDFTEGEGAHKQMFGTASIAACSFFLLRPSVPNRALMGGLNAFDGGVALAKRLAERGGALARVRQLLRG
ncbi:GNAT family N-acetyltransferase [Novosphingobium cyanobacteriorum]|jgi:CelD/BcsL family acetyltransferase involved in cellulose biosynthesis|uniref:GNAT family N-acetyltransferase n=1 Tax=Novosphingobium cyanobacteriorum TaxID=3024215 RepID=A0ABT6CI64_9SPHN|nr:GNAT family N-acetyltransferase [Novosphingobium cyanobacteriorum]MDF8333214.1 GNAT family N-acetyltransferase [Novosphingobium cyanobacteriorum]